MSPQTGRTPPAPLYADGGGEQAADWEGNRTELCPSPARKFSGIEAEPRRNHDAGQENKTELLFVRPKLGARWKQKQDGIIGFGAKERGKIGPQIVRLIQDPAVHALVR